IDFGQVVMRIDSRGGVTGEMFAATGDPLLAHRVVERSGIANDLLDGFAVAASAQRIIGVVVEGDVEHGAKIEVETKNTQQSSGDVAMPSDKIDVVLVA